MNKTIKSSWEEMDKTNFILNGFTKCDNLLIRKIINSTDPQTAMLYILLLSHRNAQTNKCFPSISLLANEMGLGVRTISRMITKLTEKGFIIIDSGRQGVNSDYYFPMEVFYNGEGVCATRGRKGNFSAPKHSF